MGKRRFTEKVEVKVGVMEINTMLNNPSARTHHILHPTIDHLNVEQNTSREYSHSRLSQSLNSVYSSKVTEAKK